MTRIKIEFEVDFPDVLMSDCEIRKYLEFKFAEAGSCPNDIYDQLEGKVTVDYFTFDWEWIQ